VFASRKRKEEPEEEVVSGLGGLGFEATRRKAETGGGTGAGLGLGLDSSMSNMETMMSGYISMMEELVESPDFDTLVTPDSLRQMLDAVPGAAGMASQVKAILESPQFADPAVLRATLREGVRTMKAYSSQMLEVFSDPSKMTEMLAQLPEEQRSAITALMSGDMSQLTSMLGQTGLGGSQKKLLDSMLSGDTAALNEAAAEVLYDSDQIEAARLEFLKEPALAEMFGISKEVLEDSEQWAAVMKEGLGGLMAGGDDGEAEAKQTVGKRRSA
jgi:lipase chaperone LimK